MFISTGCVIMPPKLTSYKSFKPPRPVSTAGTSSKAASKGRQPKAKEGMIIDSSSDAGGNEKGDEEDDDSDVFMQEPPAQSDDPAAIPPKLLTRLLHEHFSSGETRITKDAMVVLAKYIELFTVEAVGRANEERAEAASRDSSLDATFLEV